MATPQHFSRIAEIIHLRRKEYQRIVVVVSAMANATDQLISLAYQVNPQPPRREYDMLVSVGERISISLLAMALAKNNEMAVSFTGSQSGIITCENHSEASIIDVKPRRILATLEGGAIAIVAGFQGVSSKGEITTLGRGGSDTSAVALGVALKADKVEFFKDVSGIYTQDPKTYPSSPLLTELSYESALEIINKGAKVLHARSILTAQKNRLILHVRSFYNYGLEGDHGTLIKSFENSFLSAPSPIFE